MRRSLGSSFARLLWGTTTSNLGDGLLRVALPLVIVDLTRSATAVAGVSIVSGIAWLVLGLPIGAFNDRYDRRRTMATVALVRAVALTAFAFAVASGSVTAAVIYGVAFASGWPRPSSTRRQRRRCRPWSIRTTWWSPTAGAPPAS